MRALFSNFVLCRPAAHGCSCCGNARRGPVQGSQRHSALPVVDESPVRGAVITQPVVLHAPLLLPGANKRRHGGFSGLGHAVGLDQKQLALSELQEGLAAL